MGKVNVQGFLAEQGLYADRALNSGAIYIRRSADHKLIATMGGDELSLASTPDETLQLIKDKLYGNT